jgi:hypothetical protein
MAEPGRLKRLDVGFAGGQVLAVRASKQAYEGLTGALENEHGPRWHSLEADETEVRIDLSQVVYVQRETEEHRVGF